MWEAKFGDDLLLGECVVKPHQYCSDSLAMTCSMLAIERPDLFGKCV